MIKSNQNKINKGVNKMDYNKDIVSMCYFDDNKPKLIRLDITINGHRRIQDVIMKRRTNKKREGGI